MNINFKIKHFLILFAFIISMNASGDKMSIIYFDGEQYNDDRIFVLFIAKCTTKETSEYVRTIIHHETAPENHKWCVATFKNVERYMAYRVDDFETKSEARKYLAKVEPQTPLISLGGNSPSKPLSFDEYSNWKKDNNFKDYDYKKMFTFGGTTPEEAITRWKK